MKFSVITPGSYIHWLTPFLDPRRLLYLAHLKKSSSTLIKGARIVGEADTKMHDAQHDAKDKFDNATTDVKRRGSKLSGRQNLLLMTFSVVSSSKKGHAMELVKRTQCETLRHVCTCVVQHSILSLWAVRLIDERLSLHNVQSVEAHHTHLL